MKTFPFTKSHIKHFRYEMKKAGGFFELMYTKEAIEIKRGVKIISIYPDSEKYRMKYLTDYYSDLRQAYDTDIPIIFWVELFKLAYPL